MSLLYGRLWESAPGIMKDDPSWFTVVPHKYRSFSHHLEVGPFPSNFIFPSVPGPFLRAHEELGRSSEVVDLFKSESVKFTYVLFQFQDDSSYSLGLDEPPYGIDLFIFPLF